MEEKIDAFARAEIEDGKAGRAIEEAQSSVETPPPPIDIYQGKRNYRNEQASVSFGAPASLLEVVKGMVAELQPAYNLTINQYNHLTEYGMPADAQVMSEGYMEDDFIPVIMGLVDQYGADALLTCQQALDALDRMAITGNGDGTGYTAAFIRAMAPEVQGTVASVSDGEVKEGIGRMIVLADDGYNSAAVSIAQGLKARVDNGEISASSIDYATLARVSAIKK